MWSGSVPPCCQGCAEYDAVTAACRLLHSPTVDNRRRLMTMPCDVQKLLARRFRAYEEDIARDAVEAWLHPDWTPDAIVASYGRAPRDARLWLTSFPYLYLARNAVRRMKREAYVALPLDADAPLDGPVALDPSLPGRIVRALDRVRRVDTTGYAILLDVLRDQFEPRAWAQRLECSDATITDKKYLAIYRYLVYFCEVIEAIQPHEAAVALQARRFTPGEPNDQAALESTRALVSAPTMTLTHYRELYRHGAGQSLELLASPEAVGPEAMERLGTALRRVLRMD
jgi:hypothetical protein